jgi:hypothetical protein
MKFIKYENEIVNIKYLKEVFCSEIELVFRFEYHIDIKDKMFYLAGPGDDTHSRILSDFVDFLREKDDLLFDLSSCENAYKHPRS